MKILIGADHRGYELKLKLIAFLEKLGYEVIDVMPGKMNPEDDYPLVISKLVPMLLSLQLKEQKGILICGSGQGMVIGANRYKGIRASICWNEYEAKSARHDDDSNLICFSQDQMDSETACKILVVWLNSEFGGAPRYSRRIKELDNLG